MKIIILTSTTDMRYGSGMDRVIDNAKESLNKEFDMVVYISGKNFHSFCMGIMKIIINNPFSFSFIIFNSLSSVSKKINPFWRYYYYFSLLFSIKRVFYWHEMPKYYSNYKKKYPSEIKLIERFFKNKNTIQLCCSDYNKDSAIFFDKIPNVTNVNNCIKPKSINNNFIFSKFTVITVASIQEIKGVDIWTEVAIKVCLQNKDILFIWCGGIADKEIYDNCILKVKDAGLNKRILFLGKVEDATILTSAAHLYYCSSRLDSFPLAVLEAMNHGKNIIYYDSGGVVEAVGKDGIYISNFSINLTVKAILNCYDKFITNADSVYNQKLESRFYNNYTPEVFVAKIKNVLNKNL